MRSIKRGVLRQAGVNEASQKDMVSKPRLREEGEKAAGGEHVSGKDGVWWRLEAREWDLEMTFLGAQRHLEGHGKMVRVDVGGVV